MFVQIRKILFQYDWEVVEIQCAFFKIGWGIWLLLPFHTFGGASYRGLATVMPEVAWGIFILFIGIVHFRAVFSKHLWFRKLMIFSGFSFWLYMALIFSLNKVESLMIPLMVIISFFLAVNYLRLSIPGLFRDRK